MPIVSILSDVQPRPFGAIFMNLKSECMPLKIRTSHIKTLTEPQLVLDFLPLYRTRNYTLDDILLTDEIEDNYGYNRQHQHCHKSAVIGGAVGPLH